MTKPLAAGGGAAIPQTLTAVAVEVPREFTEALTDFLAEAGVIASAWEDWEGGPSRVEIFLEAPEGAPEAELALKRAGAAYGLALQPAVSTLQSEDWTETWKRFFHTAQISPRLVVRPPWESYAPRADEQVIILDPGMSFGTGRHGTTQACMQMLDELALGDRSRGVLDIGCGSGILSIAAAKLGFAHVRGYDSDPDAVRIAAENAAINGVSVAYATGDLATDATTADIVVANVLAVVLCDYAQQVAAAVHNVPGHALLLSGILDGQYPKVVESYARQGFREQKSILIGEWRSGWFVRA